MEGWGGRGTSCGVVKSPFFLVVGLGGIPCGETGFLGHPPRVPPSTRFWSRGEAVEHPSTPRTPARLLPACVKSKSSLGMSAAAFPLRLCFLPLLLASLAQAEL